MKGKRPLERPTRRWVDNIKMDLMEIGRRGLDWIYLAQKRGQWWALVDMGMKLRIPQNIGILFRGFWRTRLHGVH
jgi:hypothetical protein